MIYFTRGWANGEVSDAACRRARAAYRARLAKIKRRLSPAMWRLASSVGVHDAIIERTLWDPGKKRLELNLVLLVNPDAYATLSLIYKGAMLGQERVATLASASRDRDVSILYDEVDIDDEDGTFVHRLLFWPRDEVTIDFRSLELAITPRADDRVRLGYSFLLRRGKSIVGYP